MKKKLILFLLICFPVLWYLSIPKEQEFVLPIFTPSDLRSNLVHPSLIGKTEHVVPNFSFIDQNGNIVSEQTVNNKIYIGAGHREWNNDWYRRSIVQVLDLNNNTVSILRNTSIFYAASMGYMPFGQVAVDSSGTVYLPSDYGLVAVVKFTDTGEDYVSNTIGEGTGEELSSAIVNGGSLYVAHRYDNKIVKVGLGATIDIPAGQLSNNITFTAFKDPWFESNETIDLNIGSIENGTSDSSDIADVTIIESTRLELVADSPFEGVENGKVSWGDYDRDGDMDLALMGSASTGTITNVYQNNDGTLSLIHI